MIRVTIEIIPFSEEARRCTLSVFNIANVGGSEEVGEYNWCQHGENMDETSPAKRWSDGKAVKHTRNQGVEKLVHTILGEFLNGERLLHQ